MRVFRLQVAYDGTAYHGWQVQPGLPTVQHELMMALASVLGTACPTLHAAGRTDTGVHARGQVASFESDTPLPARALVPLLNRVLPGDVRAIDAREAAAEFHARHSARARRYSYRLARYPDVLVGRHAWWPRRALDPPGLARSTQVLEGTHDCSSFRSAGSGPANQVCRITRASWSRWEGGVQLDIIADHFLYHMVRNVVGTALAVAREPYPAGAMRAVLAARDRAAGGPTAPPQGLVLEQVFYAEDVVT
jgi:tRNA pseudouridine38-40 synthase